MATIVFDLDGTLVETGPDLLAATNNVLVKEGLKPIELTHLGHLVGQGGRAMLERAFAFRDRPADDDALDGYVKHFLDAYRSSIPGQSAPFPGAINALDRLVEHGHTLAICTNKTEEFAILLLDKLGLSPRFAAICGPDTFDVRKPDPQHLWKTIERAGGAPDASIMIGDSISDIEAARRANVPSVGVTFGYSDKPIEELSPDAVIDHYDQLDEVMVTKLIARSA